MDAVPQARYTFTLAMPAGDWSQEEWTAELANAWRRIEAIDPFVRIELFDESGGSVLAHEGFLVREWNGPDLPPQYYIYFAVPTLHDGVVLGADDPYRLMITVEVAEPPDDSTPILLHAEFRGGGIGAGL
jgi:hypothetical protein